ncbi:MAG: hypothetical protein ACOY40_13925, partial [Bacillota bacterium]
FYEKLCLSSLNYLALLPASLPVSSTGPGLIPFHLHCLVFKDQAAVIMAAAVFILAHRPDGVNFDYTIFSRLCRIFCRLYPPART